MVKSKTFTSREYLRFSTTSFDSNDEHSYDKLIIAVGSTSSTHGVPGLENCYQLKTIGDAQRIRQRIIGGYMRVSSIVLG